MNSKAFKIIPAMILLYSLQASVALPNPADTAATGLLRINGKAISTEEFAHVTRGRITLTKGSATPEKQIPVPFLIYLKRGGKIVDAEAYAHNHAVMHYEVAEILKSARAGDQLVIEPAKPEDKTAQKVITIKNTQVVPQFDWFYVFRQKKDNC